MNEDRRLYSAPRLIEFGRIEELTLGHGGGHKSIGLSDSVILDPDELPLCDTGDCLPFSG